MRKTDYLLVYLGLTFLSMGISVARDPMPDLSCRLFILVYSLMSFAQGALFVLWLKAKRE